jgi:hypothetical protein
MLPSALLAESMPCELVLPEFTMIEGRQAKGKNMSTIPYQIVFGDSLRSRSEAMQS